MRILGIYNNCIVAIVDIRKRIMESAIQIVDIHNVLV